MQDGVNVLELGQQFQRLLEKSVNNIRVLGDQIEPPTTNCSYFHDAVIMYKQLIESGIERIVILYGKPEKIDYFNFVENRYLSLDEVNKLKEKIGQYEIELWEAKEFDFLE